MAKRGLGGFFESFLNKDSIFEDKKVLLSSYFPETIIHRDEQINKIAAILAPCMKLQKPSNIFIYGKTGTGKTLSVKFISRQLIEVTKKKEIPLEIFYVNCKLKKVADTEYRLIAQLSRFLGREIPPTGLPTDEVYSHFYSAVDNKRKLIVIVLDEIDQLVNKIGDEILYNLTRINDELKQSQISLVGISNDLVFADNLDPRVKSSLSEEEIIFPPYNAVQIQHILKRRARQAFKKSVLCPGVIEKCAAYAAREHGDARRALELLRVAGEIAERTNQEKIQIAHLDQARETIERDRIIDIISLQPRQYQAVLYSVFVMTDKKKEIIFTGDMYDHYKETCSSAGLRPLTQRRVSDVINELVMFGIINARTISKGRYGRTREISISIPSETKQKGTAILKDQLGL